MKRLLLIVILVGLTVPFAKMIMDMAKNGKQREIGISSSQINPEKEIQYFEMK